MRTLAPPFLQRIKNCLPINAFVIGNGSKNSGPISNCPRIAPNWRFGFGAPGVGSSGGGSLSPPPPGMEFG